MNNCFFICNVSSEPIFKFFYMDKFTSICYFSVSFSENDKNYITVFALNSLADYVYQNIHINQKIFIYGSLYNKGSNTFVKINDIKII